MDKMTVNDFIKLQESIKKAPKEKKIEIIKILDLYLPIMEAQIREAKKELES